MTLMRKPPVVSGPAASGTVLATKLNNSPHRTDPEKTQDQTLPLTATGDAGPVDISSATAPKRVGLSNGRGGRECEGLDPREINPVILTAAGNPPMRTSALVAAYNKKVGGDVFSAAFARIKRHKDIRAYCRECAGNDAEVRRCTTFDCPFWIYRMGTNPHNPRRGRNPFANSREPLAADPEARDASVQLATVNPSRGFTP